MLKDRIKPLVKDLLLFLEIIVAPFSPHEHFKESFFLWLANTLPRSQRSECELRPKLIGKAGVKIDGGTIRDGIEISPLGGAKRIQIGKGCFINSGVRFACVPGSTITLGNHVQVGPRCLFETRNHSLVLIDDHKRGGQAKSIIVEDNVWIAANAIILPGIQIGKGSVVAAGAVVTKNVPPYTLVGGVPARVLKQLNAQDALISKQNNDIKTS